jgi:RluA family pseudouridine synthase
VEITAEQLQERVLYRDGMVLVIDKPAGIAVHAGPKGGENLEEHFEALRFGWPRSPALAHRLDRDTSGCLALGRHRKALRKLGKLFSTGLVRKTYWAVVEGGPEADSGRIDAPLKKRNRKIGWQMMVTGEDDPEAKRSVTDYRVLAREGGRSWLELKPHTGRTHQIRVHCAELGCPIVGDPVYGTPDGLLMLHARALVLPLQASKPPISVMAEPPDHIQLGGVVLAGRSADV